MKMFENDPCINCNHLRFCTDHDVLPSECGDINWDNPEEDIISDDDDELANNQPWNIADYRLKDTVLDCGDEDDIADEEDE